MAVQTHPQTAIRILMALGEGQVGWCFRIVRRLISLVGVGGSWNQEHVGAVPRRPCIPLVVTPSRVVSARQQVLIALSEGQQRRPGGLHR